MSEEARLNEIIFEQAAGAIDYIQELEEAYYSDRGRIAALLEVYLQTLVNDVTEMEDDPDMVMAEEVGEAVLSACADILAYPNLDHSRHIRSIILLRQMMCPGTDMGVWTDDDVDEPPVSMQWPWDVTDLWDEVAEE
ncbi:hypothetical protein BCR39DRAFT_582991 [Naematelia encephala]|uniref:Uncharacterized protein n=1 Tax=Naematelia encephala TaxID=71784 RepID=A0A1Y2BDE7_9TREE|nr:hypothetical protein BCR39DRAFT_582991 [Naematelia encephala]